MSKDKIGGLATILLMVALLLAVSANNTVLAVPSSDTEASEIVVIVRPLVLMNYSAVPGEKFDVNVTALGVTSLHGFRIQLGYDQNLIECKTVKEGDLFQGFGATTMTYSIDNTNGSLYASVNLTSLSATSDNNGTLITLTFDVKGTGETSLHIYDLLMYDSTGTYLQYITYDGFFNNKFNFDFTMPLTLLTVTFASLFLNLKTESKLKGFSEGTEFRVRDAVLLVGLMAVMITLIVVVQQLSAILMVLFLFSYSLLLYTFGYLLSKKRWYIGILPPAIFVLLYIFLRDSLVWSYFLSNAYGLAFAILITLQLASLFTWKTTVVFGVLITAIDIILVLVTRTMVQAASAAMSLSLPVLVSLPIVPLITTGSGLLFMSLGLGDFFFAGLLAIQTFKKFGKRLAIASAVAMTISFSLFEAFILNSRIRAFPGTLMIICGWIPVAVVGVLKKRKVEKPNLEEMVSA